MLTGYKVGPPPSTVYPSSMNEFSMTIWTDTINAGRYRSGGRLSDAHSRRIARTPPHNEVYHRGRPYRRILQEIAD